MATPMDSQEERLLEQETAIHFEAYDDLLKLVQSIPIPNPNEPSLHRPPQLLPNELCAQVLQWLVVERIQMSHVSVIGCSSISTEQWWNGFQPALDDCLSEDELTCWISEEHPDGQNQYVDFFVATPTSRVVRMERISIKTRPWNMGAFNLRDFCVQASEDAKNMEVEWKNISPQWTLENQYGWQSFEWNDPMDVRYLRLLCLSNQFFGAPNPELRRFRMFLMNAVGFYSVRFD